MHDIAGKNVVLGVSGGISAYKACALVSLLKKNGANVDVIMTENAAKFVTPLSFEALSSRPAVIDMFSREIPWEIGHISLAKKADCFVVAPATANIIGKIVCGIADDMLTTTILATKAPVIIVPAMNTVMYENPVVLENLAKLKERGFIILEPIEGRLACGDIGKGKMAEPEVILDKIRLLFIKKDLLGKKILITAGATSEKIDPARCITNYSSGKMGCALAERARARGAEVTLIIGTHSCAVPCVKTLRVTTTGEMLENVMKMSHENEIFIMAAAPCDYRPPSVSEYKIKGLELNLSFIKNPDVAKAVGTVKKDKKLVIFAAETENLIENARAKLIEKNADFVVANDISAEGAGFNCDTNIITIIDHINTVFYEKKSKLEVADIVLDRIINL